VNNNNNQMTADYEEAFQLEEDNMDQERVDDINKGQPSETRPPVAASSQFEQSTQKKKKLPQVKLQELV
jgi:hypothetical protein